MASQITPTDSQPDEKTLLNKRFEQISWGLFLVMIGCIWLIPSKYLPEGTWILGTGLILLGLNLARYMKGIRLSGFTLILGIIAVGIGLSDFFGANLPWFAILLIIIGTSIIIKPFIEKPTTN